MIGPLLLKLALELLLLALEIREARRKPLAHPRLQPHRSLRRGVLCLVVLARWPRPPVTVIKGALDSSGLVVLGRWPRPPSRIY